VGVDDLGTSLAFSLFLVAASAVMLGLHWRTWRCFQAQPLDEREYDFRRRQFRRRMQTSAMLGLLGIAILIGHWITSPPLPRLAPPIYWGVVVLAVFWLGLLAMADLLVTRHHYRRLHDDYLVQQARLQAELRRIQDAHGNGKPPQD
jgi:hypothetical protein